MTQQRDVHGFRQLGFSWYLVRLVAVVASAVVMVVLFTAGGRDADSPATQGADIQARAFTDLLDRTGISRDGSAVAADLDGAGNSLSAQTLAAAGWTAGREVVLLGTPVQIPDYGPGLPDHLLSDGQHVRLGHDRVESLTFLATGTGPDRGGVDVRGSGRVVYADGGEQEFTLAVPDWTEGSAAGAVLNLPYANATNGFGRGALGSVRLYARSVPVDSLREVSHVVLPRVEEGDIHVFAVDGRSAGQDWVGTWSRATSGYLEVGPWKDQTLRLSARTTTGGNTVRIRLDNTFASESVIVGAASIALRGEGAGTRGPAVPLTFDGVSGAVLPAGGQLFSDPVEIRLPPHSDVLISVHLPDRVTSAPVHYAAVDTNYATAPGSGDRTMDRDGARFTDRVDHWPFLTGIEVLDGTGAVVTLGDSITDGTRATPDAHARWPDVLSTRLGEQRGLPHPGILNAGVAGNHVVTDVYPGEGVSTSPLGPGMTNRVHRDVLAQGGVETVVLFGGINDLRWGTSSREVIAGLNEIAALAHTYGVRVFVATLGPCAGEARCTPEVEQARQEVNSYLRGQVGDRGSGFDGVWDFDAVLRDPEDPTRLLPAYDSGDHLHPGDAGLRALAESVDLYQLVGL